MTTAGSQRLTNFRRIALAAWVMQALIVLSGAAVRLTQAGLGCEDWPTCNEDELLPEWELHGLIEFGNRVISGLVVISTIVAVVAAHRLAPRRPDLIRYAWGLVAGTAAQVVLGGITVLADLHPIVVSVHFLLSMILLWNAQLLWVRSRWPEAARGKNGAGPVKPTPGERPETNGAESRAATDPIIGRLARLQLAMAGVVLLTGTVVTGTGPNSGDSRADRLGFELTTVARVHSVCVWMLLATVVVLSIRLVRSGHSGPGNSGPDGSAGRQSAAAMATGRWLLLALIAQGAVGYTQFALGVPAGLVELHILGAVVVWSLAIQFQLRLGQPIEPTAALGGDAATERELSAP